MLLAERSSDVRGHWAKFVDEVIHNEPKFVKRNERDVFMSLNLDFMNLLVDNIRFNVIIEKDEDELIGSIDGFWFVESAETSDELLIKLAKELKDFATDYYKDLMLYKNTPDFKVMFPMITKALITKDIKGVIESFDVQHKGS